MSLADTTGIFGMNLPYYIILLLFISYIIWLKYFNKRKDLKIKNVNELLMILNIFLFIFIFVASLLTVLTFVKGISELRIDKIDFNEAGTMFSTLAIIILVGLILLLVYHPPNKSAWYRAIFGIYLLGNIFLLVAYTHIFFIFFESMYKTQTALFCFFVVTLGVLICLVLAVYYVVTKNILKISHKKDIIMKKNEGNTFVIAGLIFIAILFAVLHFGYAPMTFKLHPESIGYKMEQRTMLNYYTYSSYEKMKFGVQVKTYGLLNYVGFQRQYIYIDYSPYDIVLNDVKVFLEDAENRTYTFDSTTKQFKSYSGTDTIIGNDTLFDTRQHIAIISYYSRNFNKIKRIYIEAYYKKNVTDDEYAYWNNFENSEIPCYKDKCVFQINITNNLNKTVVIPEQKLFFLNQYVYLNDDASLQNISLCKLSEMNVTTNNDNYYASYYSCDDINCNLQILDKTTKNHTTSTIAFSMYNGIISNHEFNINSPMEMQIKLYVNCK